MLGTRFGPVIKCRPPYSFQVAMQTFIQCEQQVRVVALTEQLAQMVMTFTYLAVVV